MKHFISLVVATLLFGCSSHQRYADLQNTLYDFVERKDANIGISVIVDGMDTISVNGDKEFPMLSVYKFPIALALAEKYRQEGLSFDNLIAIFPEDLHLDTYSPMTEKILASSQMTTDTLKLPARELLRYMLQFSDNNASDIVLREIGGVEAAQRFLNQIGAKGVNVRNTEDEMHKDYSLCYANSSTPKAMVALIDKFDQEYNDPLSLEIKQLMETCATGTNRLAKPLLPTNAEIGHKTGTGFELPDGHLMAVNDVGYIHLPNGQNCTVAVFIENSGYDMEQTEALIAGISQILFKELHGQ